MCRNISRWWMSAAKFQKSSEGTPDESRQSSFHIDDLTVRWATLYCSVYGIITLCHFHYSPSNPLLFTFGRNSSVLFSGIVIHSQWFIWMQFWCVNIGEDDVIDNMLFDVGRILLITVNIVSFIIVFIGKWCMRLIFPQLSIWLQLSKVLSWCSACRCWGYRGCELHLWFVKSFSFAVVYHLLCRFLHQVSEIYWKKIIFSTGMIGRKEILFRHLTRILWINDLFFTFLPEILDCISCSKNL